MLASVLLRTLEQEQKKRSVGKFAVEWIESQVDDIYFPFTCSKMFLLIAFPGPCCVDFFF